MLKCKHVTYIIMLRTEKKKSLAENGARAVVCKEMQDVGSVCRDREQTQRLNGRSVSSFCFCDASLTHHRRPAQPPEGLCTVWRQPAQICPGRDIFCSPACVYLWANAAVEFVIPLCNAMTGENLNDSSIGFVVSQYIHGLC